MPRHDRPSAIAENEADDHAYHKLHFLYPPKKGQAMVKPGPKQPRIGDHLGDAVSMMFGPAFRRRI